MKDAASSVAVTTRMALFASCHRLNKKRAFEAPESSLTSARRSPDCRPLRTGRIISRTFFMD